MSNTPNNAIPYVPESTIDPAAGLNLALVTIDALLQAAVQTITNTPLGSPAEGERHLVGTAGTGDFAGHDNQIAQYLDGAWRFYAARVVVNLDDGLLYFRNATGWAAADTGGVSFADINGNPVDNALLAAALADRYTKAESDGRYDATGTASGAVGAHEAAPDPHTQYTTAAEAAAAAPVQSVQGRQGTVVITAADLSLENVDNTADADKPLSDAATAALALKLDTALKGASNGLAELDNNGKVPLSQINDAVLGQMSYQGLWDAGTNTPALPGAPTNQGDYYVTSAPGTQFGLTFATGDWLVANGAAWGKVDNTDAVSTVQGRTGNVVITKDDLDIEETYTLAEKNKLAGVQAGAQVNVATNLSQGTRTATAVPITSSTGSAATLSAATTTLAGVMSAASLTKLNGIATGATANAADAQLRDRTTHTGTQPATTVTVADSGGYFVGETVEAALQEVGVMMGDVSAALDAINGEVI
tara:strand:- start:281 stop:1708 length:1428 start_codon:yes stop_codon:yes gene_type:complete